MAVKAGYFTPMLHVRSVEDSLQFYSLLGFEAVDKMGGSGCLGWARMHCEGGALMFLLSEEPLDTSTQTVMFVLYTTDLRTLRDHLLASGLQIPPIAYPEYSPSGEITLRDPDGYRISIIHWGEREHEQWQRERKTRLAAE
jgi:catechol 2,3-dioxygenase-like lactoylglutathione lyase family enzyme